MKSIVQKIIKIPFFYRLVERLYLLSFPSSQFYCENRYKKGGTSGAGSYDRTARFKADILNSFVKENNIESVIEFGSMLPMFCDSTPPVSGVAIRIIIRKNVNANIRNFLCILSTKQTM